MRLTPVDRTDSYRTGSRYQPLVGWDIRSLRMRCLIPFTIVCMHADLFRLVRIPSPDSVTKQFPSHLRVSLIPILTHLISSGRIHHSTPFHSTPLHSSETVDQLRRISAYMVNWDSIDIVYVTYPSDSNSLDWIGLG